MNSIAVSKVQGQLVVDSRLIAEGLGIPHRSLRQTIEKYLTELEAFGFAMEKTNAQKKSIMGRPERIYRLNENQTRFLLSTSRNGLKPEFIEKFLEIGFDFTSFSCRPVKQQKKSETQYSNDLAKSLSGKREVRTLAGNIDILTTTEIIEVKVVRLWKSALGQVLVYGYYYPSHHKRIHLYGETQESYLSMVRSHCDKLNVIVTWEA